jgi:hypothetical protein
MRSALFISVTLLLGAVPLSADQPAATPPASSQIGALGQQPSDRYSRLFELRAALKQMQTESGQKAPRKKVVCGMTVIEADPSLDPKMGVTPPKETGLRHRIRGIEPTVCNPSK